MRGRKLLRWIVIALAVYAVLVLALVLAESGNEKASITSFSDAVWYSAVTLTTVGYGDMYPTTLAGKLIGFTFLVSSVSFLGLFVGEVGAIINERRERKRMGQDGTAFSDHIVVIGWDHFARSILQQLLPAEREVAVITGSRDDVELINNAFGRKSVFVLFAELHHPDQFEKAGVDRAQLVFVNYGSDTDKLIAVLNLKKRYGDMRFLVALDNPDLKETFRAAGVTYALSKTEIAAKMIASYIFEPDVAEFSNDLISSTDRAGDYDIHQYIVLGSNPLAGRSYGEVFVKLRSEYNALLLGLSKPGVGGDERRLLKLPPDSTQVEAGDYLIVIADGDAEQKLVELCGTREGTVQGRGRRRA